MDGADLLQVVEKIHRERDVDKESIFQSIEQALASALRKAENVSDKSAFKIDRKTGQIKAVNESGEELPDPISPVSLGRIAAQTAKQVLIQKIREAERNVIYEEFERHKHNIVHGTVHRYDGNNVILSLSKTEGLLPKKEQVRDETYTLGSHLRAYVVNVEKRGHKVLILLSRTHPDFIRKLFELEVPEISDRTIEIKSLVREPGYRTKMAVASFDSKVDCVGACVGVRGSRIKNIIEELQGEKIDIIRWSENAEDLLKNALKPAEIQEIKLDWEQRKASVYVATDQLSLAIGKRGQNVRLAARLCGWDIDVISIPQSGEAPQIFHASSERTAEEKQRLAANPLDSLFGNTDKEAPPTLEEDEALEDEELSDVDESSENNQDVPDEDEMSDEEYDDYPDDEEDEEDREDDDE